MGLFSKEPPEKKAYNKALSSMIGKPNEKTFAAMEEASKAWPEGWQGYLFMALTYDLASNKFPFDPEKADAYHRLTKAAGEKAGSEWVECFYEVFEREAGNFRITGQEYYPRTLYIRKTGAAMMYNFELDKDEIMADVKGKDDRDFWERLMSGIDAGGIFKSTDEQDECFAASMAFRDYLDACLFRNSDQNTRVKHANKIVEKCNDLVHLKKDEISKMTDDMSGFIFGYCLLFGGAPYEIVSEYSGFHTNLRIDGWMKLWSAAHRGCMPALHLLADFFQEQEFAAEYDYAFSKVYSGDNDREKDILPQLIYLLEKSAVKGDQEALRQLNALAKK